MKGLIEYSSVKRDFGGSCMLMMRKKYENKSEPHNIKRPPPFMTESQSGQKVADTWA
jgi:hypothetical protein